VLQVSRGALTYAFEYGHSETELDTFDFE
jgi:hypothetical protein